MEILSLFSFLLLVTACYCRCPLIHAKHTFSKTYQSYTATEHAKVCSCGRAEDKQKHTFSTLLGRCTVCGEVYNPNPDISV